MTAAGMRRLGAPRPATVRTDDHGIPTRVGRKTVEAVSEDWIVEDRWWTGRSLRRRYFEVILGDGVNAVVFRDLAGGRWYTQRG